MLESHDGGDPLTLVEPVTDVAALAQAISVARRIYAAPAVKRYIVDLVGATRAHQDLRLGASPRASLQLLAAAKARAAMAGRDHVLPDDVKALAVPVLAHRLIPSPQARGLHRGPEATIDAVLAATPVAASASPRHGAAAPAAVPAPLR